MIVVVTNRSTGVRRVWDDAECVEETDEDVVLRSVSGGEVQLYPRHETIEVLESGER